jgi:hypothetical protein
MKIVIPGGTGQIGGVLSRALLAQHHEVVVLSRGGRGGRGGTSDARIVAWDGRTLGPWASELDGADAVINLAGRSVNCRYTAANLEAMMSSRVDSTRAVGAAIAAAARPPRVWLQMSTATIYAHRFDAANDEATGLIGGDEPDAPAAWRFSIDIAKAWEQAQAEAATPATRKVALRSAMVMSPDRGGIFDVLLGLTRRGLGGTIAGGRQWMSWIHEGDFARAVALLIERDDISGPVNLAAPGPLPQREFMAALRAAWGTRVGLPATRWMAAIGAFMSIAVAFGLVATRLVAQHDVVQMHLPQFDAPGVALRGRLFRKPAVLTYHCDLLLPPGFFKKKRRLEISKPEFVLNKPEYQGAEIVVAARNFACGSSRARWCARAAREPVTRRRWRAVGGRGGRARCALRGRHGRVVIGASRAGSDVSMVGEDDRCSEGLQPLPNRKRLPSI